MVKGVDMKVVLISTYELGHQPFGLASPAAWLGEAGASVSCVDLAVERLDEQAVVEASLIAVYLPMHTATRLASTVVPRLRSLNPAAHLCFFGLYAPMNEDFLRALGGQTILGGEFETPLVSLYRRLSANGDEGVAQRQAEPVISLAKQRFRLPDRGGLPPLSQYAFVSTGIGDRQTVGYTEASRGCKHLCRHCPVVPVYGGRFRIVQHDIVMDDIRQQVAAGARHITFGDPDFFNGVGHALRLVEVLHREFPGLTYDATIKIEHLLKHVEHMTTLASTGCLFVTTATESVDDRILTILDKGHTGDDFIRCVGLAREAALTLSPTFVPFTPWTSLNGYLDLLRLLVDLDLVDHVQPVQLAIRLLVPRGSRLLELKEMRECLGEFDAVALSYRWASLDPRVDSLQAGVRNIVEQGAADGVGRREIFQRIWQMVHKAAGVAAAPLAPHWDARPEAQLPRLSEPWYCCAEPTEAQIAGI